MPTLRFKTRGMRMSKNDLYSLADNLCRMMKLDANKSFDIFSTLILDLYENSQKSEVMVS